jgi:hypothetical protein
MNTPPSFPTPLKAAPSVDMYIDNVSSSGGFVSTEGLRWGPFSAECNAFMRFDDLVAHLIALAYEDILGIQQYDLLLVVRVTIIYLLLPLAYIW